MPRDYLQICHFFKNYYPTWVGGTESQIHMTSNFLSNYDNNLHFSLVTDRQYVFPFLHKGVPKVQYDGKLKVFRLGPNIPEIVFLPFFYFQLSELKTEKMNRIIANRLFLEATKIKEVRNANVYDLHGLWGTVYEEIALKLSNLFGIPLIVHLHGTYLPGNEAMPLPNGTTKAILQKANAIVTHNMNVLDKLKEWKLEKKAHLIPNGIDTEKFECKQDNLMKNSFNIAFIGRITTIRDPLTAIYAFKLLLKKIPEAKLHIVGNGHLENAVRCLIQQLDMNNSVVMYGARMDIDSILQKSDVFWSTSTVTNYPSMSLLEAFASSIPVVATNTGLTEELIVEGHNGLLVPPMNPRKLADATEKILKDETLRTLLSVNARATAEKYDIRKIGPRIAQLYYSIAGKR
jgi:glycosyltransferase involved in cell wall biosynthesis